MVYTRIRLPLLIRPFISSFSFQFSHIKIFRHTFIIGTVRPRRLKLSTPVDSGLMYGVYQNQAAALMHPFIFYFFFLQYSSIKIFITLFLGTMRPRRLKLVAHVDNGWLYRIYQTAAAYLSLYFFFSFLSLQFSNIKMFLSHLSQEL